MRETTTGREIDRLRFGAQRMETRRRAAVLVELTVDDDEGMAPAPRIPGLDHSAGRIEWISLALAQSVSTVIAPARRLYGTDMGAIRMDGCVAEMCSIWPVQLD